MDNYYNDRDNDYSYDDEEDDDYEEINPDDYPCTIFDFLEDIKSVENGVSNNGVALRVVIPFLVSPINKYIYFRKYDYDFSLLVELVNRGMNINDASDIVYVERISYYMQDYIFKNEDGEIIDMEDIKDMNVEDDMYPNINEPFWYIK